MDESAPWVSLGQIVREADADGMCLIMTYDADNTSTEREAMPCHTYHSMPYPTTPSHTMVLHATPSHTTPYHAIPYHAMRYHAIPCHTMPCHVLVASPHAMPRPGGLDAAQRGGPIQVLLAARGGGHRTESLPQMVGSQGSLAVPSPTTTLAGPLRCTRRIPFPMHMPAPIPTTPCHATGP